MQYKEIFKVVKNENFPLKNFDIFLIFAQNIDCGCTLEPPCRVLMSTHNLCFGAKIRKIGIPLQTPVVLYKSGVLGGGYSLHGHVFLLLMLTHTSTIVKQLQVMEDVISRQLWLSEWLRFDVTYLPAEI